MANVVIYVRSATQNDPFLTRQLAACREWAKTHDLYVVGEYSEVASGLAKELPLWNMAVTWATETNASILSLEPTRVSRDPRKFQERKVALLDLGINLLFVVDGDQTLPKLMPPEDMRE